MICLARRGDHSLNGGFMVVLINQIDRHLRLRQRISVAQYGNTVPGSDRELPFEVKVGFIPIQSAVSSNFTRVPVKFKWKVNQLIWRCVDVISKRGTMKLESYVGK